MSDDFITGFIIGRRRGYNDGVASCRNNSTNYKPTPIILPWKKIIKTAAVIFLVFRAITLIPDQIFYNLNRWVEINIYHNPDPELVNALVNRIKRAHMR